MQDCNLKRNTKMCSNQIAIPDTLSAIRICKSEVCWSRVFLPLQKYVLEVASLQYGFEHLIIFSPV